MNVNAVSSALALSSIGGGEAKPPAPASGFSCAQPVVDHKALEALLKNSEQVSKPPWGGYVFTAHGNGVVMVSKRTDSSSTVGRVASDLSQEKSAAPTDDLVQPRAGTPVYPFQSIGNHSHGRYLEILKQAKDPEQLIRSIERARVEGFMEMEVKQPNSSPTMRKIDDGPMRQFVRAWADLPSLGQGGSDSVERQKGAEDRQAMIEGAIRSVMDRLSSGHRVSSVGIRHSSGAQRPKGEIVQDADGKVSLELRLPRRFDLA